MEASKGKVVAIALKKVPRAPMEETDVATAVQGGTLEGPIDDPDRGVTLISSEQWAEIQDELDTDIPWHMRRANILVEGLVMADLIGKTLQLGEVTLEIKGETDPCWLMDKFLPGLKAALTPDVRGGVHGRVAQGGEIRIGDQITVVPPDAA